MAWIELHQTLPTNKKTLRMSIILKIEIPQAIGHLCMLWLWAIDNAQNGDLSGFYAEEIAQVSGWKGDGQEFFNALVKAGFVTEDKKLHDWYDYAGKLIDKRKEDADRKRTAREKAEEIRKLSDGRPADIQRTSEINPCDGAGNRTTPYHTVPNSTKHMVFKTSGCGLKNNLVPVETVENYVEQNIVKYWDFCTEKDINSITAIMATIEPASEEDSEQLLSIALEASVEAKAKTPAYIRGVYNNFKARSINSVETYSDYERVMRE